MQYTWKKVCIDASWEPCIQRYCHRQTLRGLTWQTRSRSRLFAIYQDGQGHWLLMVLSVAGTGFTHFFWRNLALHLHSRLVFAEVPELGVTLWMKTSLKLPVTSRLLRAFNKTNPLTNASIKWIFYNNWTGMHIVRWGRLVSKSFQETNQVESHSFVTSLSYMVSQKTSWSLSQIVFRTPRQWTWKNAWTAPREPLGWRSWVGTKMVKTSVYFDHLSLRGFKKMEPYGAMILRWLWMVDKYF